MTFVDDLHQQLLQRQSALVAELKAMETELDAVDAALRALEAEPPPAEPAPETRVVTGAQGEIWAEGKRIASVSAVPTSTSGLFGHTTAMVWTVVLLSVLRWRARA